MDIFLFEQITNDTLTRVQQEASGSDPINLHINSIGGNVFAGKGIFDFLNAIPNEVNVSVDGFAGSIATLIMLAGDSITATEGSFIMIHRASSFMGGNQNELRDQIAILEQIDNTIINAYQAKTGLSEDQINQLIDKDTFIPADEALQLGFIDAIGEPLDIAAQTDLININNMETKKKVLDQLKAMASAIIGKSDEDKDKQEIIDKLAEEALETAQAEVTAKLTDENQSPADKLTAELVKNVDYLAKMKQVDAFVAEALSFIENQQKAIEEMQAAQPVLVRAELTELLSKIQSKAEIPAASNAFSETNKESDVDFAFIESKKREIQAKANKQ